MSASVRAENFEIRFDRKGPRLFGVESCNLRAESRGLVVGLTGPTGCGKSTFLASVCQHLPDAIVSGVLDVQGNTVTSFLPQGSFVFPHLNASENATYYGTLHRFKDQAQQIADRALGIARELGLNLAALDRQTQDTWSGGQIQRLGLARALSINANLNCLDEPCAGLNPMIRRRFLGLLRKHALETRSLVLIATHSGEDLLWCCDHLLVWDEVEDQSGYDARSISLETAIVSPPSDDCRLHFNPFADLNYKEMNKLLSPSNHEAHPRMTLKLLEGVYLCEASNGCRWITKANAAV